MRSLSDLLRVTADPEKLAEALASPPPPEEPPQCETCGDAHFVTRAVSHDHPEFGRAFPCPACHIPGEDTIVRLAAAAGLPLATRGTHRFERFRPGPGTAKALSYARSFLDGEGGHPFLTLALAIGWQQIETRLASVGYYQVESLLDELRRGYTNDQAERGTDTYATLQFLRSCQLLILDDLGAEKATEWSTAKLDEIVDYRYINRLPTVFTLNVEPERLAPRLVDRLMEGQVFVLDAASFRRRGRKA